MPGGRPKDPNKLFFHHIGLRPADWEYLRHWQIEGEGDNFTPAINRLMEFVRIFAPEGQEVGKPRDERGRFLPSGGTSKGAQQRKRKRERAEGQEEENGNEMG